MTEDNQTDPPPIVEPVVDEEKIAIKAELDALKAKLAKEDTEKVESEALEKETLQAELKELGYENQFTDLNLKNTKSVLEALKTKGIKKPKKQVTESDVDPIPEIKRWFNIRTQQWES